MNNANSSKVTLGSTVVFSADGLFFQPSAKGTIFEVTDSRHVGRGQYRFSLTPIQEPPALNATYTDIDPDDLEVYRG